jgi:Transposase IS66 family
VELPLLQRHATLLGAVVDDVVVGLLPLLLRPGDRRGAHAQHRFDGGTAHDVDEVVEGALGVLEEVEQGQDELAVLGQQLGELLGIEGRWTAGRRNDLIGFGHRWWLVCEGFDDPMIRIIERRSRHRSCQLSTKPGTSSNIDETSWRENRRKAWLWATVTSLYTVFTIVKNRSGEIAAALLGSEDGQIVGSDRFSAYEWIKASYRQVCWAHLRRDFQAMIDRGGNGEKIGRRLLSLSNRLFRHWHKVRDGTLSWSGF